MTGPRLEFARSMARKYLRRHRVNAPPVPVEYILVAEGFQVRLVDYPDDTLGESWWEEDIGHVAVSRKLAPGRLRFTLGHELGHLVLGHHERRFSDGPLTAPAIRELDGTVWEPPDPLEVEANHFAAELLLPLGLFLRDWQRSPNAGKLAARYEVSHEAVWWRANRFLRP